MKEKFKNIINLVIKDIKYNYKSYIIFALIVPWFFIEFNYYIYSPGGLISLEDRIEVESSYNEEGSFNMTYVTAKKGIAPLILLSYVIPSWDLVSIDDSRIGNESSSEINERNQIYLKETSYDAIIASFTEANLEYKVTNIDVTVTYVSEDAKTNIKTGDIIKSIENNVITDYDSVSNNINKYSAGDSISINVSRNNKIIECYATLIENDGKTIIGLYLSELKTIETTPKIKYIFKNSESGSSRGLMCALEIYNRITEYDLTKGDIISGTGTINEDGIVGSIDGVKYKLAGAVKNNADVFIVPTENYEEAIKLKKANNYNIEIIEADNLHNVIEKLRNR